MKTDIERLIEHAAWLSLDLRDHADNVDRARDSWIALPEHLKELLNKKEKELDNE